MHFTGKECDITLYTDKYETIKVVTIVQAATEYENSETGETTILILNGMIRMGETMYHALVNTNQLRAYGMTVQDNHFLEAPIFIATEDPDFILPLSSKATILGVTTRTPPNKGLQTCPHFTCSSAHEWDPQNVRFPKSSRTDTDG